MKKFIAALFATTALLAAAAPLTQMLAWNYPYAVSPDTQFIVFVTTNVALPLSQWTPVTNVPASNAPASFFVGISFLGEPPPNGSWFLTVAASNAEWGLGATSNSAFTLPGVYPVPTITLTNPNGPVGSLLTRTNGF